MKTLELDEKDEKVVPWPIQPIKMQQDSFKNDLNFHNRQENFVEEHEIQFSVFETQLIIRVKIKANMLIKELFSSFLESLRSLEELPNELSIYDLSLTGFDPDTKILQLENYEEKTLEDKQIKYLRKHSQFIKLYVKGGLRQMELEAIQENFELIKHLLSQYRESEFSEEDNVLKFLKKIISFNPKNLPSKYIEPAKAIFIEILETLKLDEKTHWLVQPIKTFSEKKLKEFEEISTKNSLIFQFWKRSETKNLGNAYNKLRL